MVTKKSGNKIYSHEDIVEWQAKAGRHIESYDKISVIRSISGVVCIAIGITTTLIPFTTAPLIMLGSYLLGYDSKVWLPKLIYKLNLLGRWIYCNRSAKKLYRTIKTRVMGWN